MGSYKYKVSEKFRIVSESHDSIKMDPRTKVIFHIFMCAKRQVRCEHFWHTRISQLQMAFVGFVGNSKLHRWVVINTKFQNNSALWRKLMTVSKWLSWPNFFHTLVKIIDLRAENMHFRATKVLSDFSVHCSIVVMFKEPFAAVVSPPTVF